MGKQSVISLDPIDRKKKKVLYPDYLLHNGQVANLYARLINLATICFVARNVPVKHQVFYGMPKN